MYNANNQNAVAAADKRNVDGGQMEVTGGSAGELHRVQDEARKMQRTDRIFARLQRRCVAGTVLVRPGRTQL